MKEENEYYQVTAFMNPERLMVIGHVLEKAGVDYLSREVKGSGSAKHEPYNGLMPQVGLEFLVSSKRDRDSLVEFLREYSSDSKGRDGKIFKQKIDYVLDISTNTHVITAVADRLTEARRS